jgi:proteic killer suppression protein
VIKSFRHKGLKELFETGSSRRVEQSLQDCIRWRLDALNQAAKPGDMNIPGFDFHPLRGKPVRYTVHVNGPRCITFGFVGEDAVDVDLEQYH